jgi:hypothetical protein
VVGFALYIFLYFAVSFSIYYRYSYIDINHIIIQKISRALVAHAYNPSYSGDRDQEDWGLKKPITKQGWWSGSRCRL